MVKYSYIPPEYKIASKITPTSLNKPLPQHPTCATPQEPRIPYRDTRTTGKAIFGQPPSWKHKPLPPLPLEEVSAPAEKPRVSRFREDLDSVPDVGDVEALCQGKAKKHIKLQEVVHNLLGGSKSKA